MSWMSAGNYIEATSLNEPMPFSRSHLEPRKHPPSLSLSLSPLSRDPTCIKQRRNIGSSSYKVHEDERNRFLVI